MFDRKLNKVFSLRHKSLSCASNLPGNEFILDFVQWPIHCSLKKSPGAQWAERTSCVEVAVFKR